MIDPAEVFRFTQVEQDEASASALWRAEADCPYFEGHFPGMPVLPAVGLLDGSLELLRALGHASPGGTLSLRKAKFTGMLTPGMEVRINVAHKPDRTDVLWTKAENGEALAAFTFPR
jgi:3-hydroxymyristoyl/3-hydroxydecanoyl-(acyl carrier protein) dehydratase